MTDPRSDPRFRHPQPGPRSPTFNPARSSLPTSIGYSSLYAGDMHIMSPPTNHPVSIPRGYAASSSVNGVPTTTRTYTVVNDPRSDPRSRHTTTSRGDPHRRRSTLDTSARPPVIVTTTTAPKERSHPSSARHSSPPRDGYRTSEPQLLSQPAASSSSHRSRSSHRPPSYPASSSRYADDYSRSRDRDHSLSSREADAYRSARPSVMYPSDPRHSTAVIDYGDEGYQYTNAGELARYDLDHSRPLQSRRRESQDRGYYRPNISYNADIRSFNVDTSPDLSRNYNMNTSRPLEGSNSRGGPPPSTRGFDRINNRHESARDPLPAAPIPPNSATAAGTSVELVPASSDRRDGRRERPVSLYQDSVPRSAHMEDYHRSREDERSMRHVRDRSRDNNVSYEAPRFQDDSVSSRGFGIRTDVPSDPHADRRDPRRDSWLAPAGQRTAEDRNRAPETDRDEYRRSRAEPPRDDRDRRGWRDGPARSDEDDKDRSRRERRDERSVNDEGGKDRTQRERKSGHLENDEDGSRERTRRDRRDSRPENGDDEKSERSRFRDKMAAGLGIAAGAVGLASLDRDSDADKNRNRDTRRGPSPGENKDRDRHRDVDEDTSYKPSEISNGREVNEQPTRGGEESKGPRRGAAAAADAKSNGADQHSSDSDGPNQQSRTRRISKAAFNPNNTLDLRDLKEDLAALNIKEKEHEEAIASNSARKGKERDTASPGSDDQSGKSNSLTDDKSPSPTVEYGVSEDASDETRGREITSAGTVTRTVRVVSPPRDKSREKPLKGILKQPKASFPEETNPIREGVAPHKDDKKAKDAPHGARWTKISRKIVNPEALTLGKERFEVRDDFCIVLRVLSKDEIQTYAAATQVIRERRRGERDVDDDHDVNNDHDREESDMNRERERDDEEGRKHSHRHRHKEETQDEPEDRERDRDRRRRHHRRDDDDEYDVRGSHRHV